MSSDLGTTTKERRGLEGIRVVECGEGVSAAYAAKILADLGADVVKVEPPGGDLTRRRGPFPRRSSSTPRRAGSSSTSTRTSAAIVADLRSGRGQCGARSPPRRGRHPHPQRAALRAGGVRARRRRSCAARHPGLVVTSVSPFGDSGPHATWRGYELTASNAGGWAFLSPGASPASRASPAQALRRAVRLSPRARTPRSTSLAAYRHKRAHRARDRRSTCPSRKRSRRCSR